MAVIFENVKHFVPEQTFDCGQCFRFDVLSGGGVEGTVGKNHVIIKKEGNRLTVDGADDAKFWGSYLGLDTDYDAVMTDIGEHFGKYGNTIFDAMKVSDGIRILRQEPWETLCSFIVSQNNNIGRIKKIIARLCEKYGEPFDCGGKTYYAFPTAEALASADASDIFSCGTGFRAKYISDAAKKVASGEVDFEKVRLGTDADAYAELTKICGVGPKVAACTLLFGFYRTAAFPVDVWIKRVLAKYYADGIDLSALGEYAGIAQQYLFYYERYINGGK